MQIILILILGLTAGVFSALLGIGGGVLLVPGMMYFLGMSIKEAAGTSLAIIIPTALVGVWQQNASGHVDWKVFLLISVGTMIGAYFGAGLSRILSEEIIRKVFVVFLILMAIKIWRG